jgi:predicted RNA-binding protein
MNYWLVIHDLKAYMQHSDLIGCRVKRPGLQQPMLKQFAEIKKGDKIVYYASKNCVVIGIFDVVSDITYLEKDPYWNEIMVYSIRPAEMPPEGYYLDFKKLLFSETVKFDLFPEKEKWYTYLQGKTCRKLTEHDYQIIKNNLNNPEYLIEKDKVKIIETKWHKETPPETSKEEEKTSTHDTIVESLYTIGQIFGYEAIKNPSVNDLRPPDKPFKAKDKTLDLAWKIFGLTHVPFEVQIHGSIPDLIYRLNLVHQWSLKMVVIAEQENHDEIIEAAQTYPFAGKLVLLTPKEIEKAKKDYKELLKLRQKIFA